MVISVPYSPKSKSESPAIVTIVRLDDFVKCPKCSCTIDVLCIHLDDGSKNPEPQIMWCPDCGKVWLSEEMKRFQ